MMISYWPDEVLFSIFFFSVFVIATLLNKACHARLALLVYCGGCEVVLLYPRTDMTLTTKHVHAPNEQCKDTCR